MNCLEFERRLESLLEERLEPRTRRACLAHAETCSACREILEVVADPASAEVTEPGEALVESILVATVGSACEQAKAQLPAFVDRELAAADRELVELHIETCESCQRLTATLVAMTTELPQLAQAPLDLRFTRDVLAATSKRRSAVWTWLEKSWASWLQRPRFAMEAAYVGVLVIMLVLGAFSTPVAALPQRGVELMRPEPDTPTIWTRTQEGLGTFWDSVASLFEKVEKQPESEEETP